MRCSSVSLGTVYAAERLSFRERRALVEYKVPFVVPGNQLYLPDLGIYLREYLQRGAVGCKAAALKPSAQAILICSLLEGLGSRCSTPPLR